MARPFGSSSYPYRQPEPELPYEDDPDIGETERAKRRKLGPRGTGTGTPAIEEGGTYRPGSTFSQSMRGGQQQPGIGNVLGMPPQENFVDRAKAAVINTAQGMNNMVDAGQNALASVQRPDVAPARPPEGAASRNARAYADRARADLAAQAGMPTTTRAPVPVTQAAPAGYQPGQAFAQNMQQTPAVSPSPAVAVQPEAPAPQQQIAQAPQVQAPYQPPVATADDAVMYQEPRPPTEPARSRSGPITLSPVTYDNAPAVTRFSAAGAIGGPYSPPQQMAPEQIAQAPVQVPEQGFTPVNLPVRGDAPPAEMPGGPVSQRELERMAPSPENWERTSLAATNPNWNHRAMEDRAPVTDESFRGSSVPIPSKPGDEIARDLNAPYPGGPTAAGRNTIAKIQDTALSTLSTGMEQAKNEPWRQDYVRSRAEERQANANRMQFFSDEAQRNQRAANGPSWAEVEQAKSAARYADMTGMGRKHFAGRRDAIVKEYTDANAPAAHRDYVGQQIAQTASVDATAGLQQAQRHGEQTHPLAIAKGVQDISAGQQGISTAQTAEQAAKLKMAQDQLHFNMRKERADPKTSKERKKEIDDYFDAFSEKPTYQYHAVGGGEIDGQKQPTYIGGGNVRTGEVIGGPRGGQAIGQPPGMPPGKGTAQAPTVGDRIRDGKGNVIVWDGTQYVPEQPKHRIP